jgi:hypothetical protein
MVWYPVFVSLYYIVLTSSPLSSILLKGTMKISLAFGLAVQPIAKLWIKYGTVSKDLAAPGTRKHGIQGAPELP